MANLAITNTFASQTTISSSQVNQNYTDIKTWLNNRDNASDYWLNMKVLATASNPAEIKSSATDCEFDIDCTGSNGTPRVSWRRSGTTYFTGGVDGAASNLFKMGTTGLTTNVAWQIPSTGVQTQFANGTTAVPSISFIGSTATGLFQQATDKVSVVLNTFETARFSTSGSSDTTTYIPSIYFSGGGSASVANRIYTRTGVTTSPVQIATPGNQFDLFLVTGSDGGGNIFNDVILTSSASATVTTITSKTSTGAPAARTYASTGSSSLTLQMGSGTYSIQTYSVSLSGR